MRESFFEFFHRLWLSRIMLQLAWAACIAAVFELLVYLISRWLRGRLRPILLRDVEGPPAARVRRHRLLLGVPALLVRGILYVIAVLMILRILGLRTGAELLPIGLAVAVVALVAAHSALRDFVAGYLILYDHVYSEGDEVTLGEVEGKVEEMGLRRSRLRTPDGQLVIVPHSQIGTVTNRSRATKPPQQ